MKPSGIAPFNIRTLKRKAHRDSIKSEEYLAPVSYPRIRDTAEREKSVSRTVREFQRVEELLLRKNQGFGDRKASDPELVKLEQTSVLSALKSLPLGVFSLFATSNEKRELCLDKGYGTWFEGQGELNSQGKVDTLVGTLSRGAFASSGLNLAREVISLKTEEDGTRVFSVNAFDPRTQTCDRTRRLTFEQSPGGQITVLEDWYDDKYERISRSGLASDLHKNQSQRAALNSKIKRLENTRSSLTQISEDFPPEKVLDRELEVKSLDYEKEMIQHRLLSLQSTRERLESSAEEQYSRTGLRPGSHH